MARRWNPANHPRNPNNGRFVDKGTGWASNISDAMSAGRGLDSGRGGGDNGGMDTSNPRTLRDIVFDEETPLPPDFDINDYEIRNPVTGEWESVEEVYVADKHSPDFDDDGDDGDYYDITTSGDHYTASMDEDIAVRRKPDTTSRKEGADGVDPDGQPAWENSVREELRSRGYDPDDIEGMVEGFGQDYFEYADDPQGFVDTVLEDIEAGGMNPQKRPGGGPPREEETDIENLADVSNPQDHRVYDEVSGEWDDLVSVSLIEEDEELGNSYLVETTNGEFQVTEGDTVRLQYKGETVDAGQPSGQPRDRPSYNRQILEEAAAVAEANTEDGETDNELLAQIRTVQRATASGDQAAADRAADHLREMLLISYLDGEDLPAPPTSGGGGWAQQVSNRMNR